ncbi:MAG: hypothetical protein FWC46_07050, partial [Actinomycetia bacterium]|nr:hypothetical protein [Actinomycetes bacterium]
MSVRLVAVAIDEPGLDDDLVSRALAAAPPERAVAARRFRFGEDVRRAVLGDALVRVLAGRWFGVSPGEVRYGYDPQGKPRLAAREGFCFNVSHAGRYVLVGAGDAPVGVDVERIDPRLGFRQLAAMGR